MYSENMPEAFRELMLFKTMDFDDEHKKSLMKELSDALDLLHEVYYIPAIINAIDSFKTELVHKEIHTIHFGRERKSIVLDEAEWGAQNADNDSKLSSIDFIVMQNEIMHLYLKYKAECKNRK